MTEFVCDVFEGDLPETMAPSIEEMSKDAIDADVTETPELTDETFCEVRDTLEKSKEWKDAIRISQEFFTQIAIKYAESHELTKSLKKQMEVALEVLRDVISDGPDSLKSKQESPEETKENSGEIQASQSTPQQQQSYSRDDWRDVPIEDLNLKDNLVEKLKENGIDTIGRLEDRRSLIVQGKEKWPKGIGEAKITAIEDAVIDWLAKHPCDDKIEMQEEVEPDVIEQVAEAIETIEIVPEVISDEPEAFAEPEPEPEPVAEIAPETVDKKPRKKKPKPKPVSNLDLEIAEDKRKILERAEQIKSEPLDSKHPDGNQLWEAGFSACKYDVPAEDCVYVPGEEQDDWLRGWLSCKLIESESPSVKMQDLIADM